MKLPLLKKQLIL